MVDYLSAAYELQGFRMTMADGGRLMSAGRVMSGRSVSGLNCSLAVLSARSSGSHERLGESNTVLPAQVGFDYRHHQFRNAIAVRFVLFPEQRALAC
ncbi:MAG: hypothetical protein R3F44_01460 [Candidatus Competibacteraceae bacterium]